MDSELKFACFMEFCTNRSRYVEIDVLRGIHDDSMQSIDGESSTNFQIHMWLRSFTTEHSFPNCQYLRFNICLGDFHEDVLPVKLPIVGPSLCCHLWNI